MCSQLDACMCASGCDSVCGHLGACMCIGGYGSMCHGTLMSVHRALQITSEKLAILDCNHFIKSTTN